MTRRSVLLDALRKGKMSRRLRRAVEATQRQIDANGGEHGRWCCCGDEAAPLTQLVEQAVAASAYAIAVCEKVYAASFPPYGPSRDRPEEYQAALLQAQDAATALREHLLVAESWLEP